MKRYYAAALAAVTLSMFTGIVPAKSIVTEWNQQMAPIAVAKVPPPTSSTRFFSMVYGAMYEAWQAYDSTAVGNLVGNALDGTGGTSSESRKEEAVSFAAYALITTLYPDTAESLGAFMASKGYDIESTSAPAELGRTAARLVIESRANDGSNADRNYIDGSQYVPQPPTNPTAWQPLDLSEFGLGIQKPLHPHWARVTPFALQSADQFRLPPPPEFDTPEWHAQIETVITASANLTNEQKVVAEYWRPQVATPPHLLMQLVDVVSEKQNYNIDEDVKLYLVAANALMDAGISCWETKFHYDYVRPITAIRALGDMEIEAWAGPNMGTQTIKAKDWKPYQRANDPTPPFPEYGSGHSTFSGAWAEAMKQFTGSDEFGYEVTIDRLEFEDIEIEPVTLRFETFSESAWGPQGSGISRIYGGIHFPPGNENALAAGQQIGAQVNEYAQRLFRGEAQPIGALFVALDESHWSRLTTNAFQAPLLTANEAGLGLFVQQPDAGTFGGWQSVAVDPPCAGTYRLTVSLSPMQGEPGTYIPETRVRVLRTDNQFTAMGLAAQTVLTDPYPTEIQVLWNSDGKTPVRIAIDQIAFLQKTDGGVTITGMRNERLILD